MQIVNMLRTIDRRAKFRGIKLVMIRNLLEKYKNDKALLKGVLRLTRGTKLHDLIIEARPELEELEEETDTNPLMGIIENENAVQFEGKMPLICYMKEYLKKHYFGENYNKIYYDIGKNHAHIINIRTYDEMVEFMKNDFGEILLEKSDPTKIVVKDNKECRNCKFNEPVCHITAGFIAGCLENIWDRKYIIDIVEEQCQAMGFPYCVFIIKKSIKIGD
jgi:predicted hydrocarbon binding protein